MKRVIVIDGGNFCDIEGFYCEIDNLLTKGLKWKTGHNMAAFNDILAGGFGVHELGEAITIVWKNFSKSRRDFGYEATVNYYEQMLAKCHPANRTIVQERISDAKNRTGLTLLDIIVETILNKDNSGHDCSLEIIE